ncbi:MAG: lysoplasmalogenase [Gammaproteobacteria bacterium]|nr:lysoplasmalogenase [Gammaproteobacteria bacterium]
MLALLAFSVKHIETVSDKLFVTGLIFSTVGDFILDYDGANWFIFGLGSFLIAHIFYLFSLKPLEVKRVPIAILYFIYGIAMFVIIGSSLGQLFVPVLIYMSVLLLMGIFTLISKKSNQWLIVGGISFIMSDSLLGINKFYSDVPLSHVLIMVSYYFAQFALVKGIFYNRKKAVEAK